MSPHHHRLLRKLIAWGLVLLALCGVCYAIYEYFEHADQIMESVPPPSGLPGKTR